jgi:glycoside/pentoside/hexuronide:cation symporter, GPH family
VSVNEALGQRKLDLKTKLAWAVGQVGEGVKSSAFNTFTLFYYNQILGISASLTAMALGLALFSDALTDPIAGSISDRFPSRWGRRHPFMAFAAIPLAIMLILVLNPPEGMSDGFYFVWLLWCAILVRLFLTLYHIPHLALAAEMSNDYIERTSLFSFGSLFGAVAGYGFYFSVMLTFFKETPDYGNGMYNPDAYLPMSLLAGGIIVVSILLCVWGTRKEIPFLLDKYKRTLSKDQLAEYEHHSSAANDASHSKARQAATSLRTVKSHFPSPTVLLGELKIAFSSPSYRSIFIGLLCTTIVLSIEGVFTPYMGIHFWGLPTDQLALLVVGVLIGLPLGTMIAPTINRWLDKKLSLIIPSIIAIVNANVLIVLRLTGNFPENGHPIILPLLILGGFIGASVTPVVFITINSMFADIADELELATGERKEGIIYAARAFAGKAASSIGIIVGGFVLDAIAFPKAAQPGTVDPDVIFRLGVAQGPGTSIFVMASLVLYTRYRLTKEAHADISSKLRARTQAAEAGSD